MNKFFQKVRKFFIDHMPVICVRCKGIFFEKDMRYAQSTTGQVAPLCEKCHTELFHPFSKE